MTSWLTLKNSFSLFRFYVNDTLKGILNRPFFQKKRNIIIFLSLIITGYLWYFYLNMRSLFNLGNISALPEIEMLTKLTITSYVNMFIIFAIYLGVFVNSTLSFNPTALFITNLLPITPKEVSLGQKLFKLFFALIVFELILLLVFPLFNRIAIISPINYFLLLIEFHLVFIASFLVVDFIYSLILFWLTQTTNTLQQIVIFVVDFLMMLGASLYFFSYRFPLEKFIGYSKLSISTLINSIGLIFFCLLLLVIFSMLKFNFYAPIFVTLNYPLAGITSLKVKTLPSLPAVFRQKSFLYATALISLASGITWYQSGIRAAFESLSNLYFIFMFLGINYANATQKMRKFYSFYQVSIWHEFVSLLFAGIIFIAPLLLLTILLKQNGANILLCYLVFLISLIAGFLFPKSQGSFNETIALTISSFVGIVSYQVLQHKTLALPAILILLLLLLFIIRRERLENE